MRTDPDQPVMLCTDPDVMHINYSLDTIKYVPYECIFFKSDTINNYPR